MLDLYFDKRPNIWILKYSRIDIYTAALLLLFKFLLLFD